MPSESVVEAAPSCPTTDTAVYMYQPPRQRGCAAYEALSGVEKIAVGPTSTIS
jgi:hypothetical protein